MRESRYAVVANAEEEIKRLKKELYEARRAVLDLMPEKAQMILDSYYHCESLRQRHMWLDNAAEELLALAKVLDPGQVSYSSDRAYCPLCGRGLQLHTKEGLPFPRAFGATLPGLGTCRSAMSRGLQ